MTSKLVQAGGLSARTAALSSNSERRSLLEQATSVLSSACRRISEERAIQKGIEELQQLDDRALADIGAKRFDIETRARRGRAR